MNVVVDGLLTNYVKTGKGQLVLLLHGWGDSVKGLSGLQAKLAQHYQVVAVDLPGFGSTQAPAEVWNLDTYSRFLEAFLNKLELKQPYAVIGHSNGGALAVRAISLGNLQPKKLVLLAASGVRTGDKAKRLILKVTAKVGKVATFWLPNRYRRQLRERLYGVAGSDALVAPHLEETFKKTVRQDVQADAAKLELPTLLIYAADDKAIPLADGQQYHYLIKGSQLEVITDASHFVHQDQPEQVQQLVEDFLR